MRFANLMVTLVASLLLAQSSSAQDLSGSALTELLPEEDTEPSRPSLLSSLQLEDCGILVEPRYIAEVFTNTRGGISTNDATRYLALFDLPIEFDFETLGAPLPGRFFMLTQNSHGQGLTDNFVGDAQVLSNIDPSENVMQVSEYWYEFECCQDNLLFRLGKQDINTEFLFMDMAEDFIQSAYGLSPSAEVPSYPNPTMAVLLMAKLYPDLTLKTGVWDLFANGGGWGFSGNQLFAAVMELEYQYALQNGRLPGNLATGLGYANSGTIGGEFIPSVWTWFIQFEQYVYREAGADAESFQGLGFFCQYVPSFLESESPFVVIPEDLAAGLVYRGLLPGRDEDVTGCGVAVGRFELGGSDQEVAYELFYKAVVNPNLTIQPDLQYISTPSGISPDALVVGLRCQVLL